MPRPPAPAARAILGAALGLSSGVAAGGQPSATPDAPVVARVAEHLGRPTLFVDGRPTYPMFYALTDVPGGRWSWEELPRHGIETFCAAGVRLVQVDLQPDHYWREDGVDVTTVRRQLRGALDACPGAALFLRLNVGAPKWWIRRHPEELTAYADTAPRPDYPWGVQRAIEDDVDAPMRPSLASAGRRRADAGVLPALAPRALRHRRRAPPRVGVG